MEIPLEIKIIVSILCAAAVFSLAAWELVSKWLSLFARFLFKTFVFVSRKVAKGFVQNGIHFIKPKARQPL